MGNTAPFQSHQAVTFLQKMKQQGNPVIRVNSLDDFVCDSRSSIQEKDAEKKTFQKPSVREDDNDMTESTILQKTDECILVLESKRKNRYVMNDKLKNTENFQIHQDVTLWQKMKQCNPIIRVNSLDDIVCDSESSIEERDVGSKKFQVPSFFEGEMGESSVLPRKDGCIRVAESEKINRYTINEEPQNTAPFQSHQNVTLFQNMKQSNPIIRVNSLDDFACDLQLSIQEKDTCIKNTNFQGPSFSEDDIGESSVLPKTDGCAKAAESERVNRFVMNHKLKSEYLSFFLLVIPV